MPSAPPATWKQKLFAAAPALAIAASWPTMVSKATNIAGWGIWVVGLFSLPALLLAVAAAVRAWRGEAPAPSEGGASDPGPPPRA